SPCSIIHSVVSSTSALLAKVSLPSIERPPSAGGLTSSITCLSFGMTTFSPAAGTFLLGQVAGSDHFEAGASAAWATANTLPSRTAGSSEESTNERFFLRMTSVPHLGSILSEFPATDQRQPKMGDVGGNYQHQRPASVPWLTACPEERRRRS